MLQFCRQGAEGTDMTTANTAFWDDLAEDLKDPEFLRTYVVESVRIATIDAVVNALDEARLAAGLSKAALARAIGANPDAIRRLFTNGSANPTLSTVAEIAAALGMRLLRSASRLPSRWSVVSTAILQLSLPTCRHCAVQRFNTVQGARLPTPRSRSATAVIADCGKDNRCRVPERLCSRFRQRRAERLVQSRDHYQHRLGPVSRVVVRQTVQPVVMSAGAVDAYLEPASHVAVHSFPVATTGEPFRWRRRHCDKDRVELGSN